MTLIEKLAEEFAINVEIIEKTAELIDEGNTIPFIARYRKEITGGMTDVTLRALNERLEYLRNLETRKEEVIAAIEEQGKLTDELLADIKSSEILQRVEDLYKPFKKKKSTRASKAKEKGLEPLAVIIQAQEMTTGEPLLEAERFVNEELGVESAKDALEGACDIIAEIISEDVEILEIIEEISFNTGELTSEAVDAEELTVYDMYDDYREAIAKIPNHRVLAINRGEKEKK